MLSAAFVRASLALLLAVVGTVLAIAGMAQSVFYSCKVNGLEVQAGLLRSTAAGRSANNCSLGDDLLCSGTQAMLGLGIVGTLLAAVATVCNSVLLGCGRLKAEGLWNGACGASVCSGISLCAGSMALIACLGNTITANNAMRAGGTCQAGPGAVLCIVGWITCCRTRNAHAIAAAAALRIL